MFCFFCFLFSLFWPNDFCFPLFVLGPIPAQFLLSPFSFNTNWPYRKKISYNIKTLINQANIKRGDFSFKFWFSTLTCDFTFLQESIPKVEQCLAYHLPSLDFLSWILKSWIHSSIALTLKIGMYHENVLQRRLPAKPVCATVSLVISSSLTWISHCMLYLNVLMDRPHMKWRWII